jgi:SAM-dependent methyltransferase
MAAGTAIDIGAGEGANAIHLAQKGWQVTAFDYAQEGLATIEKLAREKGLSVDTIVGDILDHKFTDTYDLVYIIHLYMGPKQRPVMLANAASALTREGTLIFIGVEPYEGVDEHHADVLAPADEIAGLIEEIPEMKINKTEIIHRVITYTGGSQEADSILIKAKKVDH